MNVKTYFDQNTSTLSYIVYDSHTKDAVVIDPVLDYEAASSTYKTNSVDLICKFIKSHSLNLLYILETHAHADHLTGAQFLKKVFSSAIIAIGKNICFVQKTFKKIYNFKDFNENGIQFDRLLEDNEILYAGSLKIKVLFTPGHTPACSSYVINQEAVFTGDVLFMHDYGTGRCDFPGGSSAQMYDSVTQKLYTLPDELKVYVGHDYKPGGRASGYESSIGEQKKHNPQLNSHTTRDDFIKQRNARDKNLKSPQLLLQSLQVNIDAGQLPKVEENGKSYLKIPLNQ